MSIPDLCLLSYFDYIRLKTSFCKSFVILSFAIIVSEYDQEMPQSQTADKPVASLGRAKQQSRDSRKTNNAKQPPLSTPPR